MNTESVVSNQLASTAKAYLKQHFTQMSECSFFACCKPLHVLSDRVSNFIKGALLTKRLAWVAQW